MKTAIQSLIDDEGAVSPVIGVILMVAITVILAAVIGTFVLGLGGQVSQSAPQASIQTQDVVNNSSTLGSQADYFQFRHGGSENINFGETDISISIEESTVGTLEAGNANDDIEAFTTADTLIIGGDATNGVNAYLNTRAADISLGSDTLYDTAVSIDGGDLFDTGDSYTVTFIDEGSGQIIAEKTGTV